MGMQGFYANMQFSARVKKHGLKRKTYVGTFTFGFILFLCLMFGEYLTEYFAEEM